MNIISNEYHFSGTILVSQERETVFEQAYGFANRQLNVANRLETKFSIASVTKMFIAMAGLILSEQGHISLREKPAAYLPELAVLDKGITIHHLFAPIFRKTQAGLLSIRMESSPENRKPLKDFLKPDHFSQVIFLMTGLPS